MKAPRLLFVAVSTTGYGEVGIGADLADQAARWGARSHFVLETHAKALVAGRGHGYTLVDPGMGESVREVMAETVAEVRPDVIVLSDYFMYCMQLRFRFGVEPWFIEDFGLPLLPIDIYEWANTDFRVDMYENTLPLSDRILGMPVHLRPVPSCHPVADGAAGLPYQASRHADRVTARRRTEVRSELGLGDGDRLLFFPVSQWHRPPLGTERGEDVLRVARRLPELLASHLSRLPGNTHFALVGSPFEELRKLPAERTHWLSVVPPEQYGELLGSSDAVLSLHMPSPTVARAMFADVPAFAMVNGYELPKAGGADVLADAMGTVSPRVRDWLDGLDARVRPFRMWPMRWRSVVDPLLAGNPLDDAVDAAEVFDEAAFVGGLARVLGDDVTRDRLASARAQYVDRVTTLPEGDVALREALRRMGVTSPGSAL
ncbi:DUF6365 family protein [Amycolatopsis samaneae]|uniref:DUF6365 family protein n=1 Tax=Amycolatopsis samaneae TaxID=664691 RepID=A0ABW5GPA1_9PSEU